jgi:hypothetical protein
MRCLFGLLVVLAACAASPQGDADSYLAPGMVAGRPEATGEWSRKGAVASLDDVTSLEQGNDAGGKPFAPAQGAGGERMLVYRGSMHVEVARVEDAIAGFLKATSEWGGYLSVQRGNEVTVRLPAARFDEAFASLRTMGRVLHETREANDVTEQYLDLGIRLENAQRSRARLLELLARAEKVEDILKIEEQLRRLSEEIERMEGQRRYLADQVAMSTLMAQFSPVADAPSRPAGRPSRFPWIRQLGAEAVLGRQ